MKLALVVLLASCASAPPTLQNTEWLLTSMHGKPVIAGSRITLEFEATSAGGYGGCNWYGGAYTLDGSKLKFAEMSGTQRACLSPRELGRQEKDYLALLRNLGEYEMEGDRLVLHDASGKPALEFTRIASLPMNPADLVGTRWRVESSPATLAFTADKTSGFAGCRDYTGTYTARGDRINVTSIAMSSTECAKGDAALRAEEQFTTDLSESERYRLTGDRLELITAPGRTLTLIKDAGPPPPAAITGAPQLKPVDEAAKDPSFLQFRNALIAALERRDKEALLAVIDRNIKTDFGGGGGRADFIRHWKLDSNPDASPVWGELLHVLRLGGSLRGQSFWSPYVYSAWPESIDSFEYVAALGDGVVVREGREANSKPIATLDHHIVRIALGDPRKVVLPDGREGWVAEDDVRSPIDYRAGFDKIDGKWRMTILVAGD